jgi:hypothetical protein
MDSLPGKQPKIEPEESAMQRLLKEFLIVLGGTLFFLGLCATVGISTSTPPTSPAAEAALGSDGKLSP